MHLFTKSLLFLVVVLSSTATNTQVTLLQEFKVADSALYFDGERVPTDERLTFPDREKYDYAFGPRVTPHGDCIDFYGDYVFLTWYQGGESARNVMLTRYNTKTGTTATIEFPHRHTGFQNRPHIGESHNTIAVGICPIDGTIHLLYDMHAYSPSRPADGSLADDYFRYQYSEAGAVTLPDDEFTLDKFFSKRIYLKEGANYQGLTYPAFFTNEQNELIVRMREGGHTNGKYQFAKYDGQDWSDWTDFNVLNARGQGFPHNWGLYGDPKYLHGKLRIGFATRLGITNDRYRLNNGFHYAYSKDPSGASDWYNYRDEPIPTPLLDYRLTKISEPGDLVPDTAPNSVTMNTGADWTVTENEDIHFTSRVITADQRIPVHTFKAAKSDTFTTVTDFPEGILYSEGEFVYILNLEDRYPVIYRAPGGTNDWTEIYRATSGPRYRHGNTRIVDGKLYYYGMELQSGSGQPIWLQIFDLGTSVVSSTDDNDPAAKQPVVFPNPSHGVVQISEHWQAESYTVFSIDGQQLLQGELAGSNVLDLNNIPKGVVLLRLTNAQNKSFTTKVVLTE